MKTSWLNSTQNYSHISQLKEDQINHFIVLLSTNHLEHLIIMQLEILIIKKTAWWNTTSCSFLKEGCFESLDTDC
jgi:hypothetical protein